MKILVVDDEYVALKKLKTLLEDYGDVETATNGREALDMFSKAYWKNDLYDLYAIDIDMPDMTGLELLERINHQEKLLMVKTAKKIIVSAESTAENLAKTVKFEGDEFIVKPVKKQLLEKKLAGLEIFKEKKENSSNDDE